MPAKADTKKQSDFLTDTLKPAIDSAKAGRINLFFMDASHFVMGGIVGKVWCKVRLWVKTASGRKRYNVLGALNFVTKKIETITNDTYITSVQVVELLEKLAARYVGKPIVVLLDNASYQRCKFVTDKAAALGIELMFLPPYSPNLNLIERAWRFVKAAVLNAVYIDTFDEYCKRISNFVDSIDIEHLDEMDGLITENFQSFDKCRVA